MGFWPFGGGKKSRVSRLDERGHEVEEKHQTISMVRKEKAGEPIPRTLARTDSKIDAFERSRKLSKTSAPGSRTTSFVPPSRSQTGPAISGIPATGEYDAKKSISGRETPTRTTKLRKHNPIYQHDPTSDSSLGPENFSVIRPPTLRAKRDDYSPTMPRRKSSKRKAEDSAREREVRAMSSPIPIPKRQTSHSPGPLRRDTKNVPGNLNRRFERPTSQISLPLPESYSEADDLSTQTSFKIGLFASLSPRPTVRYDSNPRTASGKRPAPTKMTIQQAIEEEDPFSKRRIDELADNLGSSDLRDLLERDKRRREKKRDAEKAKLQRKLQRRAERQKEEELRSGGGDGAPPGTPGAAGLGIDTDLPSSPPTGEGTAEVSSSPIVKPEVVEKETEKVVSAYTDPFADPESTRPTEPSRFIRNPFEDEKDMDPDDPLIHHEDEGPPVPVKSPLRRLRQPEAVRALPPPSQAGLSPPTSPSQKPIDRGSLSQKSAPGREPTPDIPENSELDRRASDQSAQHLSSWTTFFRKGTRRKGSSIDKGRTTPSEFSNTSRESFSRKQPPPIVPPRSFKRTESGTQQRTMSKFREDLPELPISPPDSRVQSPETTTMPAGMVLPRSASRQASQSLSGTMDSKSITTSTSIPTLDRTRQENAPAQKRSVELDAAEAGTSAAGLSQSLASVDSEGSWLSGKPVKRQSGQMISPLRQSLSSLKPTVPGDFPQGEEADDLTKDEYLNQLTSESKERRESSASATRRASSIVIDFQKERARSPEPEVPPLPGSTDETWHGPVGKQPTLIRQASRAKSKEGLLNEFKAEDSDDSSGDDDASLHGETPGEEMNTSPLMRATSVEYRTHARHISAGSARLLDIRRSSVQSEGMSVGGDKSTTVSRGPSVVKRDQGSKAEAGAETGAES